MNKKFLLPILLGGLLSSAATNLKADINSNDLLYGVGFGGLSRLISFAAVKNGSLSKGQGVALSSLISLVLIAGTSGDNGKIDWNATLMRAGWAAAAQAISLLFVEPANKQKDVRRPSQS